MIKISVDLDFECSECNRVLNVWGQKKEKTVEIRPCEYCLELFYNAGGEEAKQVNAVS